MMGFSQRRCDPQSACAKRATQLLELLSQIQDDLPTTSFWMSIAQARACWVRVPTEMRDVIWEQTLDDETYHLLTRSDCPALALCILDEALAQLSPHSQLWNYVCELTMAPEHDEHKQQLRRHQRAWLRVLRTLLLERSQKPPGHVKRLLSWYLPQQMGHGMECLAALYDARKKKGDAF